MLTIKTKKGVVTVSVNKQNKLEFSLPVGFWSSELQKLKVKYSQEINDLLKNKSKNSSIDEVPVEQTELNEPEYFAEKKEELEAGEFVRFHSYDLFKKFVKVFNLDLSIFIFDDLNTCLIKNHHRQTAFQF